MEGPRGPIGVPLSFFVISFENFTTKRVLGGIPGVQVRYLFYRGENNANTNIPQENQVEV
jgi:hypothetical protein